jgi:hypothetical protein
LPARRLDRAAVNRRAWELRPNAFLLTPNASVWQTMLRAAQTRGIGVALIIALATSSLFDTVAARGAQPDTPPSPGQADTSAHQIAPAAQPERRPPAPATAHATVPRSEQPERFDHLPIPPRRSESPVSQPNLDAPSDDPDLEAALNELDRQADRDQAWASQNPGTAPILGPMCPSTAEIQDAAPGVGPDNDG